MPFLTPKISPGISIAIARVATRFYIFGILLVGTTIYLPQRTVQTQGLIAVAALAVIAVVSYAAFPWDEYEPRIFTVVHLLSSCVLTALLVYFTGGIQSGYHLLFFLIILFSYFYNFKEMIGITTVVTFFYLLPYAYDNPEPYNLGTSVITVLFFYLGTYILYGVTRIVLKKNQVVEELNSQCLKLSALTSELLQNIESGSIPESFAESLKDILPSTYCLILLLDEKLNLVVRIACPVRGIAWEPVTGAVYSPAQLAETRKVFETLQPRIFRLESDELDETLRTLLTSSTRSVMVVPIRTGGENSGIMIFGEERSWNRAPFTQEKIQLGVAIGEQIASVIELWQCHDRLSNARNQLQIAHDKTIKAERLAALGEVTRAVEHEINNPLSVIVNWSEIYRKDAAIDPDLRKKFQIIYDMAMRIAKVIRKLSEIKDEKSIEFLKGQRMTDIE